MDEGDVALRNTTYSMFVELGRAPTAAELAAHIAVDRSTVAAGWRRLHDAHALVLEPGTDEIRMASPFSAVDTQYRVTAARRSWYANCAWDAFGVCAALHVDGAIDASCPDCGDPLSVRVVEQRPDAHDLVFHCLVPASEWWSDIVFT